MRSDMYIYLSDEVTSGTPTDANGLKQKIYALFADWSEALLPSNWCHYMLRRHRERTEFPHLQDPRNKV